MKDFVRTLIITLLILLISAVTTIFSKQMEQKDLATGVSKEVDGIVITSSFEGSQTTPVLNYDTEKQSQE